MQRFKSPLALCALLIALLAGTQALAQAPAATPAAPVASSPEAQLLRALLDEVRQMRLALQRASINTHRAQRLTERLARQQNRVDSLAEEVEQLKTLIQQTQDTAREEDELKELEATINETPDPQARAQLAQSYTILKRSLARQKEYARQEADRHRERQQQLEATLRQEQSRLAELQDQLDAIERELDKPGPVQSTASTTRR